MKKITIVLFTLCFVTAASGVRVSLTSDTAQNIKFISINPADFGTPTPDYRAVDVKPMFRYGDGAVITFGVDNNHYCDVDISFLNDPYLQECVGLTGKVEKGYFLDLQEID